MNSLTENKGRARDHLANERTFLAWTRTSISVIIFGFVVAKFGITLRQFFLLQGKTVKETGWSLGIGLSLMTAGVLTALAALARYRNTRQRLERNEFKPASLLIALVGALTAIFGVLLAGYLFFTSSAL